MELPRFLQIEPVGQCNLKCQMCSIQFRQDGRSPGPPAFMPWELFCRILDQFPQLEQLHLQGLGEPMMHPRFFDMISLASQRGIRVTTNSNLTLLSRRRAELCLTSNLHCLHVSIDGATAATYERIRVGGRFRRVVDNLITLQQVKREHDSEDPQIRLVMVLMRQNLPELPDLARLAGTWGVHSMFVQHLCHDYGETSLPERYESMRDFVNEQSLLGEDTERVQEIFAQAREAAADSGLDLRLPQTTVRHHPAGTPGPQRCDWPWRGAYFSYDGYSMPCCMISTPDRFNFGSVREQRADVVWNGESYQAFRAQLASSEPPEICRSCAVYSGTF